VTRRAFESRAGGRALWALRDFAEGNYRRVDDRPFGGGPGMVMMAAPLARCLQAIRAERADAAPVVLFSPMGARLDHAAVARWSASAGAVLVCGRYEGIDQRFIDTHVDMQVSLGDFVLSGGEIAAMALLDAVARLQPGVLNDEGSHQQDSFNPALGRPAGLPPLHTAGNLGRPAVPAALLSGHHAQIERWRRDQRLEITARHRPDLIAAARAAGRLSRRMRRCWQNQRKIVYNQRLFDPLSGRPPQRKLLRFHGPLA
jgi:tRNA (guanine37-N1)-methyltransferase